MYLFFKGYAFVFLEGLAFRCLFINKPFRGLASGFLFTNNYSDYPLSLNFCYPLLLNNFHGGHASLALLRNCFEGWQR
jgi:hypothetical protein